MKKGEAEAAMPHLCEKWAKEADQPWPPDSIHHYSFIAFWSWLQNCRWPYTQFRPSLTPDTWQRFGLTGSRNRLGVINSMPAHRVLK